MFMKRNYQFQQIVHIFHKNSINFIFNFLFVWLGLTSEDTNKILCLHCLLEPQFTFKEYPFLNHFQSPKISQNCIKIARINCLISSSAHEKWINFSPSKHFDYECVKTSTLIKLNIDNFPSGFICNPQFPPKKILSHP